MISNKESLWEIVIFQIIAHTQSFKIENKELFVELNSLQYLFPNTIMKIISSQAKKISFVRCASLALRFHSQTA